MFQNESNLFGSIGNCFIQKDVRNFMIDLFWKKSSKKNEGELSIDFISRTITKIGANGILIFSSNAKNNIDVDIPW